MLIKEGRKQNLIIAVILLAMVAAVCRGGFDSGSQAFVLHPQKATLSAPEAVIQNGGCWAGRTEEIRPAFSGPERFRYARTSGRSILLLLLLCSPVFLRDFLRRVWEILSARSRRIHKQLYIIMYIQDSDGRKKSILADKKNIIKTLHENMSLPPGMTGQAVKPKLGGNAVLPA